MLFSKSFDYALRGVLYISSAGELKKKIFLEEISSQLAIPKYFLGKILNKLVKKGILHSTKGPYGGFSINDSTKKTTLLILLRTVDGFHPFNSCVLKMKKCNAAKACPLHDRMAHLRDNFYKEMNSTTIEDVLKGTSSNLFTK